MSVPIEPNPTETSATQWNYVEVRVTDGQRVLRPTHTSFDRLIFAEPPNLSSKQIEIAVTNNGQSHTSQARVLPHDPASTRIPIELINTQQEAPAKRIA